MKTPVGAIVLILISSFVGSFGAVFLKLGAERMTGSHPKLIQELLAGAGDLFIFTFVRIFYYGGRAGRLNSALSHGLARLHMDTGLGAHLLQGTVYGW